MPIYANERDAVALPILLRWRSTAFDELENEIGGWRHASRDRLQEHEWEPPQRFEADTEFVVGWLATEHPQFDPAPMLRILAAVNAWYAQRGAKGLPPQTKLLSDLTEAGVLIGAAVSAIDKRIQPDVDQSSERAEVNVEGMPPNVAATYAIAVTALNEANGALLLFDETSRLPKGDMEQRMEIARDGACTVCALAEAIGEFDSCFVPRHSEYTAAFNSLASVGDFPGPSVHESVHRFAKEVLCSLLMRLGPEGREANRVSELEIEANWPAAARKYGERNRGPGLPEFRWGALDAEALLRREAIAVATGTGLASDGRTGLGPLAITSSASAKQLGEPQAINSGTPLTNDRIAQGTDAGGRYGEPVLSERMQLALTVLREAKAIDSDHRITTRDIAIKAQGSQVDENQYKEVMVALKRHGFVDTREGRGGGCWLTTAGKTRADKL